MMWLLDTNILLRYVMLRDPLCGGVRKAVSHLKQIGDTPVFASQIAAEFWNVCTRPVSARGGYGLTPEQADARLTLLERAFIGLPEVEPAYGIWRRLLIYHSVSGVQVHDARVAALMEANGVTHILTLNPSDFSRYPLITAAHPASIG